MKRIVSLLIVVAACGKGGSSGVGGDAPPIDVAAINKQIPPAWKGKLELTVQTVGEKHEIYEVAAPKDWKKGFLPGELEPDGASKDAFGFGAKLEVSSNCDGDCVAKDWAATADQVEFKQFSDGKSAAKVLKDEKGAGRRTLIAASDDATYIVSAWWKDGEPHYNACRVQLGNEAKDLVPVFVAACTSARAK